MAKKAIRPIRIEGNVAYVPLTQGYEAIIDAADVPLVEGHNWCANVRLRKDKSIWSVYALTNAPVVNGKRRPSILMHRVIAGTPDHMVADHRDGNGLNNRRKNLRNATQAQNRLNSKVRCDNASGVKGVVWDKPRGKWRASIKIDGEAIHLGRFDDIGSAAAAYARASAALHKDFGRF